MSIASGVGSHPGDDQHAFDEALKLVLGELHELPYLPEVPGRGATANLTGRALAVVAELGADLQPAGWRLVDAPGLDHRRARSLLSQDLDALEEQAQGYGGSFKIQVAGPWTLAATVERPRGGKILGDHGARRDLAQALAEGLGEHVGDVQRRLPGVSRLVVQLDEPALRAVLDGTVPTPSGLHRHRSIEPREAAEALSWIVDAIHARGAEPWVHSCAAQTPLDLIRGTGVRGLSVDYRQLSARDHDDLAAALEAGESVALGVVPAVEAAGSGEAPGEVRLVETVLRWLNMIGLDPEEVGDHLVLTPACGLAGASPAWARSALAMVERAAAKVSAG